MKGYLFDLLKKISPKNPNTMVIHFLGKGCLAGKNPLFVVDGDNNIYFVIVTLHATAKTGPDDARNSIHHHTNFFTK